MSTHRIVMGTKLANEDERAEVREILCGMLHNYCYLYPISRLWFRGFMQLDRSDLTAENIAIPHWAPTYVEGKINEDKFFFMLSRGQFPVNYQLRHKDNLEYVFLRDNWHDTVGHLPFLFDKEYSDILLSFGILWQLKGDNEAIRKSIVRLYWAVIEFGLIVEDGTPKALGAGLISSKEELQLATSNKNNTHRPFDLLDVVGWDFDPNGVQDRHYIVKDLGQVKEAIKTLFKML